MRRKLLFIYNANAGKGKIKNYLADIIDIFAQKNYEITVFPTMKKGDATEIVESKSASYDLIVCSGGDGTLDEVVTGMIKVGSQLPLGYIPAGSTNDYANSLGLPKRMKASAKIAVGDNLCQCDVGMLDEMANEEQMTLSLF